MTKPWVWDEADDRWESTDRKWWWTGRQWLSTGGDPDRPPLREREPVAVSGVEGLIAGVVAWLAVRYGLAWVDDSTAAGIANWAAPIVTATWAAWRARLRAWAPASVRDLIDSAEQLAAVNADEVEDWAAAQRERLPERKPPRFYAGRRQAGSPRG